MAKIRNSNPKQSGGGYERLVGDKDMASIFTKAQSTVISNGTELEEYRKKERNTLYIRILYRHNTILKRKLCLTLF